MGGELPVSLTNRTGLSEIQGPASSTGVNTFDAGSRQLKTVVTGSGGGSGTYAYDVFGRTTTLPGIDAVPTTPTKLEYFADGSTYRQEQGDSAQTFNRDPLGRVSTTNIATNGGASQNTVTNHYAGTSDSPTWTQDQVAGTWSRNVTGPGGSLAILETGTGTSTTKAELQLANPHGDVVATIDVNANVEASAMSPVADYDEYGIVVTATAPSPYGWVGTAMRSSANQGGLIQMGARMYNPATGRFLTPDPVPGGTPNPYTYPPDPVNMYDLAGTASWAAFKRSMRSISSVMRSAQADFRAGARIAGSVRISLSNRMIRVTNIRMGVLEGNAFGGGSAARSAIGASTWSAFVDRNWGKVASGGANFVEGVGAMRLGASAISVGLYAGMANESTGGAMILGGVAAIGWGGYTALSGAGTAIEGFNEGCPGGRCDPVSQVGEFWKQQLETFSFSRGRTPIL